MRRSSLYAAVALFGLVAAILPWTVRNYVELGYPVLISTGGSANFRVGHWEGATGNESAHDALEVIRREKVEHLPISKQEVELYKSEFWDGFKFMATHPLDELQLVPRKFYYLYKDDAASLRWARSGTSAPLLSPFLDDVAATAANGYYFAILGLAVFAAPQWLPTRRSGSVFLLLAVAYYTLLHSFVFVGDARYHMPLLPIFSVMAATGLVRLWSGVAMPAWMSAKGGRGKPLGPRELPLSRAARSSSHWG